MESLFQELIDINYKFPKILHHKQPIKQLHYLLSLADKKSKTIEYEVKSNQKVPPSPEKMSSKYFPYEIQELIHRKSDKCTQINLLTPLRKIQIDFIFIKDEDYSQFQIDKYINLLVLWFSFLDIITPNPNVNKVLQIKIYLTKEKKILPSQTIELSSKHVNSALTYLCQEEGDILIYREEEWFKVLLHECIHSYCLDFSNIDQNVLHQCLQKKFPIEIHDPHYSETYAEVWAEIINIALLSYSKQWEIFSLQFEFYLQLEIAHSISKATDLLKRNNASFERLREKTIFKQETHVYEYHILKTILLFSTDNFLMFCLYNNGEMMIPFVNKENTMTLLCKLIGRSYQNPAFFKSIKKIEKLQLNTSLRMSLCEL